LVHANTLRAPGIYALLFRSRSAVIRVGALGDVTLPAGWVVYVGSAFGSGGLAGRLRHHLSPVSRPRWHLDYLRTELELSGAWIGWGPRRCEHEWAGILAGLASATLPRTGFGASDCRCASHLFHWRQSPGKHSLAERLLENSSAREVNFLASARLRVLAVPRREDSSARSVA
jgi:Uri superfamily endonuclease